MRVSLCAVVAGCGFVIIGERVRQCWQMGSDAPAPARIAGRGSAEVRQVVGR